MSLAPTRAGAGTGQRNERLRSWFAALVSVLLHLVLLLIALHAPPITVSTPQGSAAGGLQVVPVVGIGNAPPPPKPARPRHAPRASRLQTTPIAHAAEQPPDAAAATDARSEPDQSQPDASRDAAVPVADPTPAPHRPSDWGQPPGMLPETTAPADAGTAASPAVESGARYNATTSGPDLEADGYQVVYDLSDEPRLRAWRDRGMTELFLPLPGTRRYMVCPLETALRRESGPCRLLDPKDPALAKIGDARQVINMQQVYHRGEPVWRGPGPYR